MINLKGYEWATHQPMLRAVLDAYAPKFILELGAGEYSTPLFSASGAELISVETDLGWIEYLAKYETEIIHHDIKEKDFSELTEEDKTEITEFYKSIEIPDLHPRLLFVDQWAMCRALSVNALKDKFDIIIYHDSELSANHWELIDTTGFYIYDLKTDTVCTTLLAREKRLLNIDHYIIDFLTEWPECKTMYVDTR